MRALVVLLSSLGALAGVAVGAIAHHAASRPEGWTLYSSAPPRRYADYLPAGRASWFPGIVEYAAIGLAAGLLAALVLAAFGFRLVHAER